MIERCLSYARYHRGQSTEHAGLMPFFRNPQTSPAECFTFLSVDVLLCVSLAVLKVLQHSLKPVTAAEFQQCLGLHSHLQSNEPYVPFTISPDYNFGI